jgi:hypothetical protein
MNELDYVSSADRQEQQYDQLIGFLSRALADVLSGKYRRADHVIGVYTVSVYKVGDVARVDIKMVRDYEDACVDLTSDKPIDYKNPPW